MNTPSLRLFSRLCPLLAIATLRAATPADFFVEKQTFAENPQHMDVSTYSLFTSTDVTEFFGSRGYIREGFMGWNSIEKSIGVYDFTSSNGKYLRTINELRKIHRAGSTPVTCINMAFTPVTAPQGKNSVPSFYTSDITVEATRTAALNFAWAFTQKLLNDVGEVIVLVDYESCFNFQFSKSASNRAIFHDWFIEVTQKMGEAAEAIGKRDLLRIAINLNANICDTANSVFGGGGNGLAHTPQTWMLECTAATDVVTLDNYIFDPSPGNRSNPATMLRNIQFLVEKYSRGKPVIVTESGYATSLTDAPDFVVDNPNKANGTYEDQAAFFASLITGLQTSNQPGGVFNNQLRGFCIWETYAKDVDGVQDLDDFYGLILDGLKKPAFFAVQDGIRQLDESTLFRPSYPTGESQTVTAALATDNDGATVTLATTDSRTYESLRCTFSPPTAVTVATLAVNLATGSTGGVVVRSEEPWTTETWATETSIESAKRIHTLSLLGMLCPGTVNAFQIRITGNQHPSTLTVDQVSIDLQTPTTFAAFQSAVFTTDELADTSVSGPDADPDHDGQPNFLEYALGTDSRAQNPAAEFTGASVDGYLTLSYPQLKSASDVTYVVEVSGDLVAWAPNTVEVSRTSLDSWRDLVTVRDSVPMDDAPTRFIRLRATQ